MKNIFIVFMAIVFLSSCQNQPTENRKSPAEVPVITIEEFFADPGAFVGKEIAISGMVTHVCKHGGQKLFLAGTGTPETLRINTSEAIPEFDIGMEGSKTQFTGVVKIMDDAFIAEAKAEEDAHHPDADIAEPEGQSAGRNMEYYIEAKSYRTTD